MFQPPLLPSSGCCYKNTDIIKTNCQTEQIQSLDVTVIVSGAPHGCKMSDYVLLKTDGNYTVVKNKSNWVHAYGTY